MLGEVLALFMVLGSLVEVKADCPDIVKPEWGEVFCSAGYSEGSICTLSCEKYYDLAGTTEREIQTACQADGQWSNSSDFTCDPIRCHPEHQTPENGDLICSADNLMASLCVFYCDEHYEMLGVDDVTAYSTCEDDGDGDAIGRWTNDEGITFPPTCKLTECQPPREDPINGRVVCSASNFAGSFCVYYCNPGYDMVGTSQLVAHTMCQGRFGDAKWTRTQTPKCRRCRPVRKIQILMLFHSTENQLVSKLISRYSTILGRRRNTGIVKVQRFGGEIGEEQFTSTLTLTKEDRDKIENLPLPKTDGADIGKALEHASRTLKDVEDGSLQVLMIITDEMKIDDGAETYAKQLRENGVEVFAFGFPGSGPPKFTKEDLAKCTGDSEKVFVITSNRLVEKSRGRFLRQVAQSALEKGCSK